MASKLKNASKKTVILMTILVVILLVAAVTGTVVFLKNRGSAEATDLDSQQVEREIGTEETNSENGETPEQPQGQQTETPNGEQANTENNQNANQGAVANQGQNAQQGQAAAGQNAQGANAGTTTDNIQETTITRAETVEIPEQQVAEGHYVGWSPISIQAEAASAKMNVQVAILNSEKTAVVMDKVTGEEKTIAKVGDQIKYTISVENIGNIDGNIVVKDAKVKEDIDNGMLKLVEGPNGMTIEELAEGKEITVAKDSTSNIEFTAEIVKVDGPIINIATIGEEDKEVTVETRDIDIKKVATLEKAEKNNKEEYKNQAEVGDTIKYVVTVTNNGSEDLTNIQITDSMWKASRSIDVAAGKTETIEYLHTVIPSDMAEEKISNIVTAKYEGTDEDTDETETDVRKEYSYIVEYYYDNVKDESKTEKVEKAIYGSEVSTYTNKEEIGYKFSKTENLPLTITENEENNVIKVYYVKDDSQTQDTEYTVQHVVEGETTPRDTQKYTSTAWINDDPAMITIEETV